MLPSVLLLLGLVLAPPPPTQPPPPPLTGAVPPGDAEKRAEAPLDASKTKWRPGIGLEVKSTDGRYSLQFGALAQLQASVVHAEHTDPTVDLVFRRARIVMGGNLFAPHILYKVQLTASPVELGWRDGTIHRSPILD
jgi:hypothetical protein